MLRTKVCTAPDCSCGVSMTRLIAPTPPLDESGYVNLSQYLVCAGVMQYMVSWRKMSSHQLHRFGIETLLFGVRQQVAITVEHACERVIC